MSAVRHRIAARGAERALEVIGVGSFGGASPVGLPGSMHGRAAAAAGRAPPPAPPPAASALARSLAAAAAARPPTAPPTGST